MAPVIWPFTNTGRPPLREVTKGAERKAFLPLATMSSNNLLSKPLMAAVLAFSCENTAFIGAVLSSRVIASKWPPSSTMLMATGQPCFLASATAAAIISAVSCSLKIGLVFMVYSCVGLKPVLPAKATDSASAFCAANVATLWA